MTMTIKKRLTEETWRVAEPGLRNDLLKLLGLNPDEVIRLNISADIFGVEVTVEYSGKVVP